MLSCLAHNVNWWNWTDLYPYFRPLFDCFQTVCCTYMKKTSTLNIKIKDSCNYKIDYKFYQMVVITTPACWSGSHSRPARRRWCTTGGKEEGMESKWSSCCLWSSVRRIAIYIYIISMKPICVLCTYILFGQDVSHILYFVWQHIQLKGPGCLIPQRRGWSGQMWTSWNNFKDQ